jgi:putative ABC transport system ATP-binding protein
MQQNDVVRLDQVIKIYTMGESDIYALNNVSLSISPGDMVAILGTSGSGKSTLLNIMGCLDKPTKGAYYLDGQDVSVMDKNRLAAIRNKKLGFIFQGFNLLGRVNALDNIQLPLVYAGMAKKEMEERAREVLSWVGLSRYAQHYPNQMSGGQQQRVAIARALVNSPSLILADEPTGALDSRTSLEIISIIQKMNIDRGITVVMVTHERDLALYCRRSIRIKDGQIIEDSQVSDRRNASEDLAALRSEVEVAG